MVTGAFTGNVLSMLISGVILKDSAKMWTMIFYLYGVLSLLWLTAWILVGSSNPDNPVRFEAADRQEQIPTANSNLNLSKVRRSS